MFNLEDHLCPHDRQRCYYTFAEREGNFTQFCQCCGVYGEALTAKGCCVFCNAEPKPKKPKEPESIKVYFP